MTQEPLLRLILVRHGETQANREFRYLGARDDALSDRGCEQTVQLAEALASLPIGSVYSSPLQRAYQTALPIAARHQLDVQVADDLREGSFGMWEGMSRAEVQERSTSDAQQLLAWESDTRIAPPEGESFAMVQERVLSFVNRIAEKHGNETVILVSHVGPIKVLLCSALGAPLDALFHIFLDPATISVIDWRSTRPVVRLVNSHAHLGWEQARWMHRIGK